MQELTNNERVFVLVEGNIAAGKTTLIDRLKFDNKIWSAYVENFDRSLASLHYFYTSISQVEKQLSFFAVQSGAINEFVSLFFKAVREGNRFCVFDRSVWGCLCFIHVAYENGLINKTQMHYLTSIASMVVTLLMETCRSLNIKIVIIHLNTSVENCLLRYAIRDNHSITGKTAFEKDNTVDEDYLKKIRANYSNVFTGMQNLHLIDGNEDQETVWNDFNHILNKYIPHQEASGYGWMYQI